MTGRLPPALTPGIRTIAALAACLAIGAAAAGCGREGKPDLVNGKELFIGKGTCGSCHALARAGTRGAQGPDLDAAFAAARRDGMDEETVEGIVYDQIANVRRGSIMPEDLVKGEDRRDVAAYVGLVAGVGGRDEGKLANVGRQGDGKPAVAKGGKLEIPADPSGALAFEAAKATAEAGPLEVTMPNESPIEHNIAIEGGPVGEVVGTGGVSSFELDAKPGKITYVCTVPGHAEGGMKGELTVE